MKGIILLSHGPMAKGVYETTKWFFGEDISQYEYLCLEADDTIEEFDQKLQKMIAKVDSGEGVLIFTDLLGGTPCNRCVQLISEHVEVFAGMNLTIVLEQLARRLADNYDNETLIEIGRAGLTQLDIPVYSEESEDDFFDE